MTIKELSAQYEAAAQPLRDRLRELRLLLSRAKTSEERWRIQRRIQDLTPLLTEMNEISWLLAHYYEIGGGDRDDRYGFNGKRRIRSRKKKVSQRGAEPYHSERIDGESAPGIHGIPLQGDDHSPDGCGQRGKQKHRKPYAKTSRAKSSSDYTIPIGSDALLERFFTKK